MFRPDVGVRCDGWIMKALEPPRCGVCHTLQFAPVVLPSSGRPILGLNEENPAGVIQRGFFAQQHLSAVPVGIYARQSGKGRVNENGSSNTSKSEHKSKNNVFMGGLLLLSARASQGTGRSPWRRPAA